MKNAVIVIVSIFLGIIMLASVMTISGRDNRQMELEENLSSAVEESVETLFSEKQYEVDNKYELVADLTGNLSHVLDSDSAILINIEEADAEQGILSVHVIAEFAHPNGKPGKVECERTVIYNKLEQEEPQIYKVSFYIGSPSEEYQKAYKVYQVLEGDLTAVPVNPTSEQGTFAGWVDENGMAADFLSPVEKNATYYALWT